MSKKANPAWIGSFVLGAVVLGAIAVAVFGGGTLWDRKFKCVLYFEESVSGLDVGAPVDYQGVRIGTVTDVQLEFHAVEQGATLHRPVTIRFEESRIAYTGDLPGEPQFEKMLESMVEEGLRARLGLQSLLTGKLKVELGFFPDQPAHRRGDDPELWEMPTVPSPLQHMIEEATQVPLGEIMQETHRAVQRIAEVMDPETTRETAAHINRVMKRLDTLLADVDEQVKPLGAQAASTLKTAEETLTELQQVTRRLEHKVEPFLESVTESSQQVSVLLDPHSPARGEFTALVRDLRETSRSLRRLTDHLEQHPESIWRGKQ